MRWRKMEGQRYLNLDKRAYQRDRDRIRRYNKWRGNRCKWIIIVNTMDVWGKRRERVEGREEEEKREEQGVRRGTVGASNVAIGCTGTVGNTGTVNIGAAANIVNIGTVTTSGTINIGNGANTTTKFNGPITLGSAPSSLNHIGYFNYIAPASIVITTTFTSVGTLTLPAGSWIISYQASLYSAGVNAVTNFSTYISGPTVNTTTRFAYVSNSATQNILGSNGFIIQTSSFSVSFTSSTDIKLYMSANASNTVRSGDSIYTGGNETYIYAMRIG